MEGGRPDSGEGGEKKKDPLSAAFRERIFTPNKKGVRKSCGSQFPGGRGKNPVWKGPGVVRNGHRLAKKSFLKNNLLYSEGGAGENPQGGGGGGALIRGKKVVFPIRGGGVFLGAS